jgi:hypothetical protein
VKAKLVVYVGIAVIFLNGCGSQNNQSTKEPKTVLESFSRQYAVSSDQLNQIIKHSWCLDEKEPSACNKNKEILEKSGTKLEALKWNNVSNAYSMVYAVDGQLFSGAVMLPDGEIKGVLLFFRSILTQMRNSVPSCIMGSNNLPKYCDGVANNIAEDISALFPGYVIVIPDYPGYGINSGNIHSFLQSKLNARVGLSMLHGFREMLGKIGYSSNVAFDRPQPLIVTGVYEGAMYALWALDELQNGNEDLLLPILKAYIPEGVFISGPYDLRKSGLQLLSENSRGDKLELNANQISALTKFKLQFTTYLGNSYIDFYKLPPSVVFQPDFYKSPYLINSNPYDIYAAFKILKDQYEIDKFMNAAALNAGFDSENNSAYTLIRLSILRDENFINWIASALPPLNYSRFPLSFFDSKSNFAIPIKNTELLLESIKSISDKSLSSSSIDDFYVSDSFKVDILSWDANKLMLLVGSLYLQGKFGMPSTETPH